VGCFGYVQGKEKSGQREVRRREGGHSTELGVRREHGTKRERDTVVQWSKEGRILAERPHKVLTTQLCHGLAESHFVAFNLLVQLLALLCHSFHVVLLPLPASHGGFAVLCHTVAETVGIFTV
jgi:hypothetical protein